MGCTIGPSAADFAAKYKNARITQANRRTSLDSKEARTARRTEQSIEHDLFEEAEGICMDLASLIDHQNCDPRSEHHIQVHFLQQSFHHFYRYQLINESIFKKLFCILQYPINIQKKIRPIRLFFL
ncbi:uncharacterized protein LOC125502032 [Athalia rosae]|uniref:uncharacterized protein LOC125502032 n=1 Tax=Athalia rosae TaxID=37344 RepID=UPI002034778D|nr:uncharacterized protein LOC125502032 [Athalia rosae]